jgi:hypothetical protein
MTIVFGGMDSARGKEEDDQSVQIAAGMGMLECALWLGWVMEWCELDINNKWELRRVDETRGEDGESMR